MSNNYRKTMRRYEDLKKIVSSQGADSVYDGIVNDNLFAHMMDNVAPRIWMSLSFDDNLASVLARTTENITNRWFDICNRMLLPPAPEAKGLKEKTLRFMRTARSLFDKNRVMIDVEGLLTDKSTFLSVDRNALAEFRALYAQFDAYVRPPYPKFWIDIPCVDRADDCFGVLVEENPTAFLTRKNMPLLHGHSENKSWSENLRQMADTTGLGFAPRYRCLVFRKGEPLLHCINFVPGYREFIDLLPGVARDGKCSQEQIDNSSILCRRIASQLRTSLLLLNARNSPFVSINDAELDREKNGTPDSIAAFEKRLKGRNRPGNLTVTTKVLRFDLSRILKKHPNLSPEIAFEALRRHTVSGHFKLRSKGLTWWSAHMRGLLVDGETDEGVKGRQRKVSLSEPKHPLTTPDHQHTLPTQKPK